MKSYFFTIPNLSGFVREQGIEIGREQGIEQTRNETIRRMIGKKKYGYDEIAEIAGVSVDEVRKVVAMYSEM